MGRKSSSSYTMEVSTKQVGEELTHYSHSKHPLRQLVLADLFMCSGCKEYGAGKRFSCEQCDYQLHEFCALSSNDSLLNNHSLHPQHQLIFHAKHKPGISWAKCDVCGIPIKGFSYKCKASCSFQMHPYCAMLSTVINIDQIHPHSLRLLPSSNVDSAITCGQCKIRRSGRMYSCTVCGYHIHVVCAKSFVNGLQANGVDVPDQKSRLGSAARVASQVVIEFLGGIIDGVGEGVGEMLVQNIARGNRGRRPVRE